MLTHTYTRTTHTRTQRQVSMNILFVYLSKLFTHFESEHILQRISILPRNKTQAAEEEEEEAEKKRSKGSRAGRVLKKKKKQT